MSSFALPSLPDELWHLVARALAHTHLPDCRAVSSLFLAAASEQLREEDDGALARYLAAMRIRDASLPERLRERYLLQRRRALVVSSTPRYVCLTCRTRTHLVGACEACRPKPCQPSNKRE